LTNHTSGNRIQVGDRRILFEAEEGKIIIFLTLPYKEEMKMYKFIPIICLTIFVAACSAPISKQAKEDLASPINCATAREDIRTLESEKASVAKMAKDGVTSVAPVGAAIGILTFTEKEKLEVGTGVYNKKIDAKIAEIKRECGIQ
jgi:hypothetical protein